MIFTTQSRQWELGDPVPAPLNHAHVHSQAIITDTVGWTLVSGSFVADSAYQYVMLGNPFDNASTDTLHFANLANLPQGIVLVDNVCVSMNPNGCPLAAGVANHGVEGVRLYPNPAQHWITVTGLAPGTLVGIHDVVGRSVWEGTSTGGALIVEAGHWARGSYVLNLDGKERKALKFVLVE